ncbi:MAG: AmmeMemoRadiSam system radical SAM enzyme, partial [Deltaproteobacteria bacterium]|nr:AmmeMemoRadiSam system radical SAM enzyme [Deltaproteobacteria bacterium]
EFAVDFAEFCGRIGLKRTLCTAGYVLKKPLQKMLAHFEAVTVTYKGATDDFYRHVVDGSLSTLHETLLTIKSEGKWLEVATLIVPTLNDSPEDIRSIAKWIKGNLGEDTPWHLERFNPQFKLTQLPPTSQNTMETARKIGLDAGLKFVYLSNISPHEGNHTYCPSCQRPIIRRLGFKITENLLNNGRCSYCQAKIPGRWT